MSLSVGNYSNGPGVGQKRVIKLEAIFNCQTHICPPHIYRGKYSPLDQIINEYVAERHSPIQHLLAGVVHSRRVFRRDKLV